MSAAPEDRIYAGLVALFATLLLGLAGWALGQPLPEAARLEDLPERTWTLLRPPDGVASPPLPAPAPAGAVGPSVALAPAPAPPPPPAPSAEEGFPEGIFDEPGALMRWLGPLGQGEAAQPLPSWTGDREGPLPDWLLARPEALGGGEVTVSAVVSDAAPRQRSLPPVVRVPVLEGRLVSALLRQERARLDRCVAAVRRDHPWAEGRYDLHLEAMAEGRVGLSVGGPDPRVAAALQACLLPWSRQWRLPPGARGQASTALILAGP